MTLNIDLDIVEETAKLLYIRALKILPDDIKLLALPVLSHRLGMRGRFKAADVVQEVVASLPLPPLRQHS